MTSTHPTTQPTPAARPLRRATVRGRDLTAEIVAAYLPSNYKVVGHTCDSRRPPDQQTTVLIEGTDSAGWTLDGYVIPRLASGLMYATETHPACTSGSCAC